MNYTCKKIKKLAVNISGIKKACSVRSVELGKLTAKFADGHMIVELPLDITDMLLIDH